MRKIVIPVLFSFSLGIPFVFSQDLFPSRIKEVTLFSDQALVKRVGKVKVKQGVNRLLLELKAFNVDKDSVFAKVFGEGEILSVQCKDIYLEELPQEKIKVLKEKLQGLRRKRTALLDEEEVLEKKEAFLDSVINFSQSQVPQDMKTAFPQVNNLESILTFIEGAYKDIKKKKEELNIKIEDIDKEISTLERELASLVSPDKKTKKVIEVLFNAKREQTVRIEASYLVYNASWQPFYKLQVPLNLGEVTLTMFSRLTQKTGEDWQDIKLSISNVIPFRGVALPSLESWFVDINRYKRREFKGLLKEEAFAPSRNVGVEKEAEFVYAQKKELPLSFEYQLPQLLTIESKDKETVLPLFSKKLKGRFFYYAVPKISPLTFLVCQTTFDEELLSGMLNVYFGGRFVGKTFLREKKPQEAFYLNLGADRGVKVKKEKVKDKLQETFFGKIERKTVVRELGYKITIENTKDKPVVIRIMDSIPVSRTDKIGVKDIKFNPQPAEIDYQGKEGVNLWEFKIDPGQKKQILIEFKVTYPKGESIVGL